MARRRGFERNSTVLPDRIKLVPLSRLLIAAGLALLVLGLLVQFAPWLRLGRLPGDVSFGNGNVRFWIPLGTSLLLSVLLTLALALFARR